MKFHNIIIQARDYYRTLSQKKEVRTIMSGIPVRRLSQSQKKLISQYFKTNIGITTHDTLWHEMYYSINNDFDVRGKSSVSCPLKPSDSAPLKHSTMPP